MRDATSKISTWPASFPILLGGISNVTLPVELNGKIRPGPLANNGKLKMAPFEPPLTVTRGTQQISDCRQMEKTLSGRVKFELSDWTYAKGNVLLCSFIAEDHKKWSNHTNHSCQTLTEPLRIEKQFKFRAMSAKIIYEKATYNTVLNSLNTIWNISL